MRVLLFARARDLAKRDIMEVSLPAGATVADLRRHLALELPALTELLKRSAIAVNNDYSTDATPLDLDAEVAVLPPVSGG